MKKWYRASLVAMLELEEETAEMVREGIKDGDFQMFLENTDLDTVGLPSIEEVVPQPSAGLHKE